jgi:LuxR family maltose regulon positive regulatory protein
MLAFVDALPSWVRLVLGSRCDPPFPLGRIRVQGRLLELRQVDLRFTNDEIAQTMSHQGIVLGQDDLEHLANLTEGWAAGVHLAALSFDAGAQPDSLIRRLVETDRSLVDFLMSEVIELQAEDVLHFLVTTAELGEFDAALCDSVLERTDSADVLAAIMAANLFLVGLHGDGARFRYHHLFGEFLRARLRTADPQRIPVIHRSAAASFDERGDLVNAIRHSMRAGDTHSALERLTTHIATATTLDDQTTGGLVAQEWLAERGVTELRTAPQRILACVVALNAAHMRGEADLWIRRVAAIEHELDHDSRYVFEQTRSFHLLYQGDPSGALAAADRAQAILEAGPVDSIWVPTLPMMFLQAQFWLGDADGAAARIEAYDRFPVRSPVVALVRMPGYGSQVAVQRGDFITADRLAAEAETAARRIGLPPDSFGMAELVASAADVALEWNRTTDAEACIEHLMRIVDNGRRPLLEVNCHLLFARLASMRRDHVVTEVHLDRARRVIPEAAIPVVAHIDRVQLRYDLGRGAVSAAESVLGRLPPSAETDLLEARICLSVGDDNGARAVLARVTNLTLPRLHVEHRILTGLAEARRDPDAAHGWIHDALGAARALGWQQTIVAEGPQLWDLLRSLPAVDDMRAYVDELLAASVGAVLSPSCRVDQRDVLDPLSERELTVLRYLASRLDALEVAAALYLSVNTVRSHVKAIYRKLEVNTRAQAVRRGHELGFI